MAKCNQLTPLSSKGLTVIVYICCLYGRWLVDVNGIDYEKANSIVSSGIGVF